MFILRITPGGKNLGEDRTLWSQSNNKISIGWSYLNNLNNCNKSELETKITEQESIHNDNKNHINHIVNTFNIFINKMNIGDIVLIPQPSTNGHDGTNLYVVKILSEVKYNSEFKDIGCAYYRDAEWCPQVLKWRISPYHSSVKKNLSFELMHFMWKPYILRKTLTGPHSQFNEEALSLYQSAL